MLRAGLGYDSHRLLPGRPLKLGGVEIPSPLGTVGHSDADVVLHAVVDAMLGAAGLGDIGEWFPDTDPHWHGADSAIFVRETLNRLNEKGYQVHQVDVIILAETPRLGPYKESIRRRLAELLGLPLDRVNIKAKTSEGMGAIGRSEGIACQALVTIVSRT
jgi:2-C-methyl-D-erythritol 2,4-cyclodiphosphate synthase